MLAASGLDHSFWAEAVSNACYTLNRVIFRPGTTKTPYEIWRGKKPNIAHLKVFGSPCFIYRDREYLTKFDAICDKGVFLGYALNSRAYRVYNKRSCKIMESVNVAINDALVCMNDGCVVFEQATNPERSPNEDSSSQESEGPELDNETDSSTPRRDATLAIQPPHRVGKRQVQKDHDTSDIIGEVFEPRKTRSKSGLLVSNFTVLKCFIALHKDDINTISFYGFVSTIEPKSVKEALLDADWISAMQEELNQFERSKVWHLVPRPSDKNVIGTKSVFKYKNDEK